MTLATIPVDRVEVGRRLRDVSEKQVDALIASIGDVGLLNPITVYPRKVIEAGISVDGYGLVAGAHRLEAVRRLGHTEVAAHIVTMGDLERQIAECDENLCGSVLSPGERARFTARRKEAYEALHPEAKAGAAQANGMNASLGRGGQLGHDVHSFADDQAAKTGQSARAIRRDAERGQQVCQEALDILKGTKADTGVVLDMLKDLDPETQIEAAKAEVQKRQKQSPRPVDIASARRSKIDADVKDRAAVAIAEWMVENADAEALDFLKANLFAAGASNIAVELTNLIGNSVMDKAGW